MMNPYAGKHIPSDAELHAMFYDYVQATFYRKWKPVKLGLPTGGGAWDFNGSRGRKNVRIVSAAGSDVTEALNPFGYAMVGNQDYWIGPNVEGKYMLMYRRGQ